MTTRPAMNGATSHTSASDAIAIIGIGCRLPGGVTNPASFWQLLEQGVDAITEIPRDRWSIQKFFDPDPAKPGHTYAKWGGFVDKIEEFDAQFFGISPREAAVMDPQHRMLLETAWEALEDGGQVPAQLAGSSTGVFIGIFMRDYEQLITSAMNRELLNNHTGIGMSMSIAANRISYVFDFTGPSVALDTACSSSLIAVHLACQSLRNGESTMAVAGGASLILRPESTIATSKASMLSPDGRCKSFDARANGYVRAEGCGVIILKPLSQAVADGDPIYAVIRGSATNQDGRSNGLTVPNGRAQEAALLASLQQAGVKPEQIQYVEAHGTGTFVGDPIEANALGNVLGKGRKNPCWIGSVKSNIGHLEATAGVAGLIKAALALKHRMIPANLHFETPNPQIAFRELNLQVPTSLMPWPEPAYGPRFASVNSFGFGGANANVVLEEAPVREGRETGKPGEVKAQSQSLLLPLSARSLEALSAVVQAYRDNLAKSEASLADICYSAALRRGHHNHRAAFVASSTAAMAEQLSAFLADKTNLTSASVQVAATPVQLTFVYSGMGTQWWAMGRQLFQDEPIFREAVLAVDKLLQPLSGWSLVDALLAEEASSQIQQTNISQPAIFAVQAGLTALWRAWGLVPTAIVGHSVGEIAAAHAAGALSLADAVLVIYQRSRLQHTTAGSGTMLAVGLPVSEVAPYLNDHRDVVSIGAINSPSSITLAGGAEALKAIGAVLDKRNIFNRFLQVEVPYHSPQMEPIRVELIASLATLKPQAASIPLYSTVTGDRIDGTTLTGDYWWRNVREPMLFANAVANLHNAGSTHFLEVSPHPALVRSVQECLKAATGIAASSDQVFASLRRELPEREMLLGTLGKFYKLGYPVAWAQLVQGDVVTLPSYPWQREHYWLESDGSKQDRLEQSATGQSSITRGEKSHPLLGGELNLAPAVRVWEGELERSQLGYLDDHRVQSTIIYPGAAYLEMSLAVAALAGAPGRIADVAFRKALPLAAIGAEGADTRFQVVLSGDNIEIYSQVQASLNGTGPGWVHHATSKLQRDSAPGRAADIGLNALRERFGRPIRQAKCYQDFRALGLHYGPAFQGITQLWRAPGEALAQFHLHESVAATQADYHLHPVLLDLCLQTFLGMMAADVADQEQRRVFLPVQIEQIIVHQYSHTDEALYCHARLTTQSEQRLSGDLQLCDATGKILVELKGVHCQALAMQLDRTTGVTEENNLLFEVAWQLAAGDAVSVARELPGPTGNWLIFADIQGVAQTFADRLRAANQRAIVVFPGQQYERIDGEHFRIHPARPADLNALFTALIGQPLKGVVHLWSLDTPAAEAFDPNRGCISTLHLLQNLRPPFPNIWLVTQGARAVADQGLQTPGQVQQSPLWGLGRVIGQEHPELQCVCVDLDPGGDPIPAVDQLFAELALSMPAGHREEQVAWRHGQRYVARLATPKQTPGAGGRQDALKADASYLITGGLGALGLHVAHALIDQGARHLVLSGRSGRTGKETAIQELEQRGAIVLVVQADVADPASVTSLLETIKADSRPLRGIVHAAGVLDDGVLRQQSAERFAKVLAPKLHGAWNLHVQTQALPLDFFVCFSSVASLLGSPGQGNYAAGNAFMDAVAHHRRSLGLPAQTINWGPWAETGMAADEMILGRLANLGIGALLPTEGIEVFSTLLQNNGHGASQVGVIPIDWPRFYKNFPGAQSPFFALFTQNLAREQVSLLEKFRSMADSEWREELVTFLRAQLAQVLGFNSPDKITFRQRLFDLGLDSLMAMELKNRLERSLELVIPPTLMFDYPTVEALATHLAQQVSLKLANAADAPMTETANPVEEDAELTALLADLEGLSEDEVAALLAEELGKTGK